MMPLIIDDTDLANIKKAKDEGGEVWENKCLTPLKRKIKLYYRQQLLEQCCYCKRNIQAEFNMVLDIEHILPKKKFLDLMFAVYNLSVSCKRCNMQIKGDDISFVVDVEAVKANPMDRHLYKFIHPNFDTYNDHLLYFSITVNDKKIVKYKVANASNKGAFTYGYFKLSDFEIDSLNVAQGLKQGDTLLQNIEAELGQEIKDLLSDAI